jgi:cytochrome c oxidase subunit 4
MSDQHGSAWNLWKGSLGVWGVLLALLTISAASAYVPLGSLNAAMNLALAAVMLGVLATFLMNLRWANGLIRLFAAGGLFWLIFMFALTSVDYFSRG